MIDLYTYPTPNGRKPAIMLEEVDLPYTLSIVDINQGEQFQPEFVALNPNRKIPALKDHETGITVFESGAILIYLAQKTEQLLPIDTNGFTQVMQWLMFQMANVGPIFGQLGHFINSAPDSIPYAVRRYEEESMRLLTVLDQHLQEANFLAGDYSIADIATYPWIAAYDYLELDLDDYPFVNRWFRRVQDRPAVQRGMAISK
ncbi:glutathione S-transferase N-terminal domain-containing protein [Acaryochloris marina]|uniref:glutathione S-transferase N-terminal domain-containing protein n=1 Tax=Acaryochloris marina TaxID=155978 RepID=UPI0021C3346C|nr:glutathione S-transferase N-terminal domain-containing protein [Acaryochloris marina]BDM83377.1 thiol:disulfide oxidoreductase [Acaryochloris marina MBIC10699]